MQKTPRNSRLVLSGVVAGSSMDKSIVVAIKRLVKHPKYEKRIYRTTKVMAHDENNEAAVGDEVEIMITRPLSKRKRWRLIRVLKTATKLG
ncbi:MAG: 30S ribosomal protein S17 [Planctomycetes bacterium]|nr:30S ribosomal protein S17 [Planctomycetota bacterium]